MSIVDNRKAFHDYFIEERYEAGLVLEGWEVKAIRAGQVSLGEAYVMVREGALYLIGCHITALKTASTHVQPDPSPEQIAESTLQQADREGGTRRVHARAARPALSRRLDQGRDRAGQGQEAA